MQAEEAPRCSICGGVMTNFPVTMSKIKVQMRCRKCVQARSPDAYKLTSLWTDVYDTQRIDDYVE